MEAMDKHEKMVRALLEEKSLEALVYLIDAGRELEFLLDGEGYFISKDRAAQYVSLWKREEEQSFDTMQELIERAKVKDGLFCEKWQECTIETLF